MKPLFKLALIPLVIGLSSPLWAANDVVTNLAKSQNIDPTERAKIEQVVQQYLMQKPEIIIEAVQNYQQKQYEQAEKTIQNTQKNAGTFVNPLFHEANDPIAGNQNGPITITEFFDYQCPHCVTMAPVLTAIIKANPDVRVVFKEFPIRGPISDFASRAALAANKQGKYNEFSHALLSSKVQPLTEKAILEIAKNTGLNVEQLQKDMNDASIKNQIQTNIKLAQQLKLFGTPAFFIGKTNASNTTKISYVPGRMDQNQMQTAIDQAKKS